MITALLIFLLANVIISEKVELNYTSASYVLLTTSKEYIDDLKETVNSLVEKKLFNFDDETPNSFVVIGLKVVTGEITKNNGQTLPKWKVNVSAKKGSDKTEVEADCTCIITDNMGQLFCEVDPTIDYESFEVLNTDNDNIKISVPTKDNDSVFINYKRYLLAFALLLII